MTVLRRLDAVLEPTKQAVLDMKESLDAIGVVDQKAALRDAAGQAFDNTSKFTLKDLRARASRSQLKADFEDYLDGFSPSVQDILENFEFRNQIPRLSKADALGSLIEKLTSPDVNLSPDPVMDTDGTIVAFSGEKDFGGEKVTEASLNNFPPVKIAERFQEDPYRFLVCADKFQTGYDEPLLHTMYVDKTLSGIKAVQTLSRLNRSHQKKHDVFVLDFLNDAETITEAFSNYYRTTILADETDHNKLHDLQGDLDGAQVYSADQVKEFVKRYLDGVERDQLDPILDQCVAVYLSELDEDQQVAFKSKAKGFVRTYSFLSSILTYNNQDWEERSIFLNFLIPKLPAPIDPDLSKGILETIDMDSYRVEKRAMRGIMLEDEDTEIGPVPGVGGGGKGEVEIDRLSEIIKQFNERFGGIEWADEDRVRQMITETIPAMVAEDTAFQNARENSDRENARVEHDKALGRVMTSIMKDDTELFRQFADNPDFKRWLGGVVFEVAYGGVGADRVDAGGAI